MPDCVQLYRDMETFYRSLGEELLQNVDPADENAKTMVRRDEVSYELDAQTVELSPSVAGADSYEPMYVTRPEGFLSMTGYFLHGPDEVPLPRLLESRNTPPITEPTNLGALVLPVEDRPFLTPAFDLDAAWRIAQEARGVEEPEIAMAVAHVTDFLQIMQAAGHELRYLSEEECSAFRAVLPQLRQNVAATISENELEIN